MALFDAKAGSYDTFCETPIGRFVGDVERKLMASLADPKRGEQAIDLGCGTGTYTSWLETLGLSAVGVDISDGMLSVARRKYGYPQMFIESDLHQLPFEDNSFNLAIANVVLEFVSNPEKVLEEVRRVLKPGGRLVIGFIGRQGPWGQKYLTKGQADPASVYHKATFYTAAEASSLGWDTPSKAAFGLWIAPDEFVDENSAWEFETAHAVKGNNEEAGFFALRWDK